MSGLTTEETTTEPTPALPPMSSAGFGRWMWRQFTSMRTALILLFLLAFVSIPGSILPQRGTNPVLVEQWIADAPTWGPLLDSWGFFDVYAAPWFAAVYLLLFISLIGCVLPRIGQHWRTMRTPPPPAPRFLGRLPEYQRFTTPESADQVLDRAADYLSGRRWRVRRSEQGEWIAAEKGYLRETGNLVFHLALVGILIAVAIGGLFGWRGNVIVKEGSGFSNTLTQYDAWGGGRLSGPETLPPFAFTLQDFRVEFDRSEAQLGAPRLFEADVELQREPGGEVTTERIEVNYPLTISGAKVFLVGHGYAPQFTVTDAQGRVVLEDSVVFLPQDGNFTSTGVIKIPDATPQIGIQGLFLPTTALDEVRGPFSTFPEADDPSVFLSAWAGDLGLDTGEPQSIYTLETEGMEQLGLRALIPGQTWELPDGAGTVTLDGYTRWSSFQIAFDPGKEAALAASVIAILGLLASLFVRRRRVWVRVGTADDGTTLVEVAGLARTEAGELPVEVADLATQLKGQP
jgi:cytochrome c biogenesis protein